MVKKRRRKKSLSIRKELEEYSENQEKYEWAPYAPVGIRETPQKRYRAIITLHGTSVHIGTYDILLHAMLARDKYVTMHNLDRKLNILRKD